MWGDLSPPGWISQKFALETSPGDRSATLCYGLMCSRYVRAFPNRTPLRVALGSETPSRSLPRDSVPIEGRSVVLEARLSSRELEEVLFSHPQDLLAVITTRFLLQAHKVYGLDPRSGTRFEGLATPAPSSPLFDPRLLVQEYEDLIRGEGPLCCFCSTREPGFVWGNGALMWVHQHCWGAVFGVIEEVK